MISFKVVDKLEAIRMSSFKVGDKLEVIRMGGIDLPWHQVGCIVTVKSEVGGEIIELEEDKGDRWFYNNNCYRLAMKETKQMNKSNWKFNVVAPEAQIDFDEIYKDLSSKNPIALVEFNKEYTKAEQEVLTKARKMRKQIDKLNIKVDAMTHLAELCDEAGEARSVFYSELQELLKDEGLLEEADDLEYAAWEGYVVVHQDIWTKANILQLLPPDSTSQFWIEVDSKRDFAKYIKWVEEVKAAKWPEDMRNKGVVSVKVLEV